MTHHDDLEAVSADLFSDVVREDPYPHYDELRRRSPVHWSARHGSWIVTRYDDVRALLRDGRIRHWSTGRPGALDRWLRLLMPASQSRLRALSVGVFGHETVATLQHEVSELALSLVQAGKAAGSMDAVRDYAEPIALAVMYRVLGIPADRQRECAGLARDCGSHVFASDEARPNGKGHRLRAFALELAADKRAAPHGASDLLGALLLAQRDGDPMDDQDLAAFLTFFMFAAFENICNFIGNAVLALALHPAEFRRLTITPTLVVQAVEELLRFDSPVQFMMMAASEPVPVGGVTIAADDGVLLGIGAANRDPERFVDPHRVDVARPNCAHLTFGFGPLTCIGAALARLEGQIAIGALAATCSEIALAGRPRRRLGLPVLRGVQSLPVALPS